jgi:1A family penicillin-binding protein
MPIPSLRRRYGHLIKNFGKGPKKWGLFKIIGLAAVAGLCLLFISGTIIVAWVSRDLPDPDKLNDRQILQSTKIYDRSGNHLLYEVYQNQKRTMVNMDQISDYAKKATIAIEDKNFYQHSGIAPLSILRAAFNNIIGKKSGSGGASTLTQQLIKITIVGDQHSIFRKIKEAILSIKTEKKYTKDQILKMYLNEIPYGSTNYGIEAASQSYFRKAAKDLTLAESATLAALVQAPSRYLNNLNLLKQRRDYVLQLMKDQGYISDDERKQAADEAIHITVNSGPMDAPHFVLYVRQLLADKFGEQAVDEEGLSVITSLDYDKQMAAEKIVKEQGDKYASSSNANNAALVALDPKTAQVLAMVGSRDYNNDDIDGQFNVAVLGLRQPGSSFKPFVYTAAFEKGYTPDTVLYDVKTNFDMRTGGNYSPKNYDGKEHGLVTMRKALQGSLNIPAVKTLYLVGSVNAIDFAKKFGYTTFTGDYGLSLVLGGAEVNLLEHTNAYATLANNGIYNPTVSILKVTNFKGETLYEWQPQPGQEAIKPELAATITGVLSDDSARAYIFGAHGTLTLPDRPVAAKTGTTNDSKDAWTLGYVPSLTVGVWVGNTTPAPMKGGGNTLAGTIWNQFMKQALKDTPAEQFPTPPPNDATKPVLRGGDGGITLDIDLATGKIAASNTPSDLVVKRTFMPTHDILYYVNKDDPRGPALANPADDPQYNNWEAALQDWVKREQAAGRSIVLQEPPTEYAPPQNPELMPNIEIINPQEGQIFNTRQLDIQIKATAPRGIAKITYQIDSQTIGFSTQFPFSFSYYAQKLLKGPHSLKVIAEDDMGNWAIKEVGFALQADFDPAGVEWFDKSPLYISTEDYPRPFNLTPFRWEDITSIKIYLSGTGIPEKLIYDFNHKEDSLFNGQLMFTWKNNPGAGEYELKAVLTDNKGSSLERRLTVRVQ